MKRRLLSIVFALLLIGVSVLWTFVDDARKLSTADGIDIFQANGWIGDAPRSSTMSTLGSIVAGLGVALGYVTLQKRR